VESLLSAFLPASSPFALPRSTYYRFPPTREESGLILLEEGIASFAMRKTAWLYQRYLPLRYWD
jgi:hypothetical protein